MYKYIRSLVFYSINSICKIFLEIFIFNKKIRTILKGNLAKHREFITTGTFYEKLENGELL